jgi:hypothetical protein
MQTAIIMGQGYANKAGEAAAGTICA